MAREMDDNSTKIGWSVWSYKNYRRLLDEEIDKIR
jgi:beta-mannanase